MKTPRSWAILSAVLFAASCAAPALSSRGEGPDATPGWLVLATGWVLLKPPAWYANPVALVAWALYLQGNRRAARAVALVGAALGASVWFIAGPSDLLVGYYLWQASFLALAAAAHAPADPVRPREAGAEPEAAPAA